MNENISWSQLQAISELVEEGEVLKQKAAGLGFKLDIVILPMGDRQNDEDCNPKTKKRLSLRRIVLDFIDQERTLDECTKHARSVGWCPSKDDRRLRASVQDALSYFCRAGYVMRIGPSLFCPASNPPKRKSVKIHHRDEEEILALTVEPHVIELAKKPLKRNGKIKKAEEVQREIKCLTILLDNALPTASKYGIMLAWMEATQMKACNFYSRRNRLTPTYKKKYKNLPSGERTFVVDEK